MGSLRTDPERVTVVVELPRLLGAPALLWNDQKKTWEKCERSVQEMFFQLMWLLMIKKRPDLGDATQYGDYTIKFDPKTNCMVAEFIKVKP